jgi:hypothetical protein
MHISMTSQTPKLHSIIERLRDLLGIPQRLTEIDKRIQQQTEAIRASDERQKQDREIQPVWLNPVLAKYDQSERDKKTNDDRHYRVQNSIRWATWCAFIAASIYGAITYRQWKTAQDQLKASERPWIAPTFSVDGPLVFRDDLAYLTLKVDLSNVGHSPAQYIQIWSELWVDIRQPSAKDVDDYCGQLKKPPNTAFKGGFVLFPDQKFANYSQTTAASRKQVDDALKTSPTPGKIGAIVIACIDYRTVHSVTEHHQSRAVYAVVFKDLKTGAWMGGYVPQGQYAPIYLLPLTSDAD